MTIQHLRLLLPFIIFLLLCTAVNAQPADSTAAKDTVRPGYVARMQLLAKKWSVEGRTDFETDKGVIAQARLLEELKKVIQEAKITLKNSPDTAGIKADLANIERDYAIAGDGVWLNKGTAQTFRNLTATAKILSELSAETSALKQLLDVNLQQINNLRYRIDSLSSLPALFKFPADSAHIAQYIQQLRITAIEIHPVDSMLKQANTNVLVLLNQTNILLFKLQASAEEAGLYKQQLSGNTFKREFSNLWQSIGYYRPFSEILAQAVVKNTLMLRFYAENNSGKLVTMVLLVVVAFVYLRSLKSIYIQQGLLTNDLNGQLVLRYPFWSALLIVINLFQFMFLSPPFVLNVIWWLTSCICLSILFRKFITGYWMNVWLAMVLLFAIAAVDNLVLQASRTERWFMLAASVTGAVAGLIIVLKGRRDELREKWIVLAIGFMALLELGAVLANLFGRYNLAKSLFIAGFLNVVIAILFLWTVRLVNEGLYLAFSVYTRQDRKLFFLNFQKVGNKVPPVFYIALVIGWLVLFGRNFAGFEYAINPVLDFFVKQHTIGDYTFSISNLLIFIGIIAIAVIISKIVSFFATDTHTPHDKDKGARPVLGSWLLLIRIAILSLGFFLAIAAAGIPLDKITIVIGALGVGIGFGLQTLVNNLVSGLIIAFEKPVNVGDIVDIDGQGGTMKSIGFRSSVIATWDGADLVMPNGDLLNSHLINWSLGGNRKRIALTIGISYNANLDQAKTLLAQLLDNDDRILKNPAPVIQYEQFGSSAIDVKLFFWTHNLRENSTTKSDIIMQITAAFKQAGITIPYPQQDVYVHKSDE